MYEIVTGRIWEASSPSAWRVLADRLWPRGIAKAKAPWDEWVKEIAPSTALRQWYGHVPERFDEFRDRYWQELMMCEDPGLLLQLVRRAEDQPLILLTATKDIEWSHLPVLRDFLQEMGRNHGK